MLIVIASCYDFIIKQKGGNLPLLEKDEIVEDPLKLMVTCYLPPLYWGELVGNDTSVSMGKYMAVYCSVANQYGANEVNSIAYECPQGHLHCMEDNVYVEILDDQGIPVPDGVSGNIYVTTCHNHAMPFIRYGIGDRESIAENTCSCGHHGRILKLKSGRGDDWVWMENGRKINLYVFIRAIEAVNVFCGKLYSEGNSK